MSEKRTWPELVGKTGDEATTAIKAYNSSLTVQVLPEDSMVTMDYREDRVRIFVDPSGKVSKPPQLG